METSKGAPVFVKIEDYRDVLDVVDLIKGKLNDARKNLAEIKDMKNEEDSDLDTWSNALDEIERKLETLDKTLFEPESTL